MQAKKIIRILIIVGLILIGALLANRFVDGWNWSFGDFIFAGVMLFGTGLAIEFVARKLTNPVRRTVAIIAIILLFLLIWIEAAVGIFNTPLLGGS